MLPNEADAQCTRHTSYIRWMRRYAAPQFSEGARVSSAGRTKWRMRTTNVKTLRWLSPRVIAGHNEIKVFH
jgi:hypothetical protein